TTTRRDRSVGELLDLARLQARCADVHALGRAVDQRAHALDVGVPATLGPPVGVADPHAEGGVLPAHLTHRCHRTGEDSSSVRLPGVPTLERLRADDLRAVVTGYRDALRAHQDVVNRLNVYPVPDGDTGTNMALTLESVVVELDGCVDMPSTCKAISHGSLMGAR